MHSTSLKSLHIKQQDDLVSIWPCLHCKERGHKSQCMRCRAQTSKYQGIIAVGKDFWVLILHTHTYVQTIQTHVYFIIHLWQQILPYMYTKHSYLRMWDMYRRVHNTILVHKTYEHKTTRN